MTISGRKRAPVILPIIAFAVAAAVLLWQPWDGDREAAAGTVEYRLCDLLVQAPPDSEDSQIIVSRRLLGSEAILMLRSGSQRQQIDAKDAAALETLEGSTPPIFSEIVASAEFRPLDPATAPWPYTSSRQLPSEEKTEGVFRYREPDPASGLLTPFTYGDGDGFTGNSLEIANCRSRAVWHAIIRDGEVSETSTEEDIHPDDEAAFDTFFDAVTLGSPD